MSGFAKIWAWQQKNLTPTERCVLVGLADFHTTNMGCFPSLKTIAENVEVSEDTVIRSIKKLIEKKLIRKINRTRDDGGKTSNLYEFLFTPIEPPPIPEIAGTPSRKIRDEQQVIDNKDIPYPADTDETVLSIFEDQEPPEVVVERDESADFWAEAGVVFEGWRIPDKKARPLIGKLLKHFGGDYKKTLALIEETVDNAPDEPIPWLMAAISGKKKTRREDKRKQVEEAFAMLEREDAKRRAEWREKYGTDYGILPDDAGKGGEADSGLLRHEPPIQSSDVLPDGGKSTEQAQFRRVAEIVRPRAGHFVQSAVPSDDSGIGTGSGPNFETW